MKKIERRQFLTWMTALTAGILVSGQTKESKAAGLSDRDRLGETLPKRRLGRTGEAVTMLGVGGWHIGHISSDRDAQETIEAALEGGVRFFDTAESYQQGASESRFGRLLTPKYRDDIYLMTKTFSRDGDTAREHLEGSLRRLRTDHLDLWQVHTLLSAKDVDSRIEKGVFDVMIEAKESGKVRHIGFTGHSWPHAHQRVLERSDIFDTCQMPINLADPSYGGDGSFIKGVLPTLVERNIGALAMKTLANSSFFGGSKHVEYGTSPTIVPNLVSLAEALHFVWSLPISVLITGAENATQIKEKIALAQSFVAMDETQREALIEKVADVAGYLAEPYKNSSL